MDAATGHGRFYDGGLPASGDQPEEPPDPTRPASIVLERRGNTADQFAMRRRLAYHDRLLGELLVPRDPATFRTDLTSVPMLFTWLVPRTGTHLPAVLLHDGLVPGAGAPAYVSTEGHRLDRVAADRVFRDAMAATGTRLLRRWLVWSAVTTWTMLRGNDGWGLLRTWGHRLAVVLTGVVVAVLDYAAIADLVDQSWPLAPDLPWMGGPVWLELTGGVLGAVVVPSLLGWAWGEFRVAGWVMGIGLALLLPVTVVLAAITLVYQVAERVVSRLTGDTAVSAASRSRARHRRSG